MNETQTEEILAHTKSNLDALNKLCPDPFEQELVFLYAIWNGISPCWTARMGLHRRRNTSGDFLKGMPNAEMAIIIAGSDRMAAMRLGIF